MQFQINTGFTFISLFSNYNVKGQILILSENFIIVFTTELLPGKFHIQSQVEILVEILQYCHPLPQFCRVCKTYLRTLLHLKSYMIWKFSNFNYSFKITTNGLCVNDHLNTCMLTITKCVPLLWPLWDLVGSMVWTDLKLHYTSLC